MQQHNFVRQGKLYVSCVNPVAPTGPIVFDNYYIGWFGQGQWQLPSNKYDIIIFQGCLTCTPWVSKSVFRDIDQVMTELNSILVKNGLIANISHCYWDGLGSNIKGEFDQKFQFLDTLQLQRTIDTINIDVWRKQ